MTAEVIRSESPATTESSRSSRSLFSTDLLEQESALSAISDEDDQTIVEQDEQGVPNEKGKYEEDAPEPERPVHDDKINPEGEQVISDEEDNAEAEEVEDTF
jgi:hypothetical protein